MKTLKTKIDTKRFCIAIFMIVLLVAPVLLAGCGEPKITAITLAIEDNVSIVEANESYGLTVTANTGANIKNVTLEVLKGNSYVSIKGMELTVNDNAPSNAEILVVANYEGVLSNQLSLIVNERVATSLSLSLSGGNDVEIGKKYTLNVTSDIPDPVDATVRIVSGGENATIEGLELTISDTAVPGTTIILEAATDELTSNRLVLTVEHIEATSIALNLNTTTVYAGEIVPLSAKVVPSNATREIEYIVLTNNAVISNNNLIINNDLAADSRVSIRARIGEVESSVVNLTVEAFDEADVLDLVFNNDSIADRTLTVDTSITSSNQSLGARLIVSKADDFVTVASNKIEYIVADPRVLNIVGDTIQPLQHGSTQVTATFGAKSLSLTVNILRTPEVIYLPTAYNERDVDYNFTNGTALENFTPDIPASSANGCTDYALVVSQNGENIARFEVVNGETTGEASDISYSGGTLKFDSLGTYSVMFSSLSGCSIERTSLSLQICINNGVNVSTVKELQDACQDTSIKIINITNDIIMSGGKENFKPVGDKEINGNGHTIDASEQIVGIKQYGGNSSSLFYARAVDDYTPYTFVLRDIDIEGSFGYLNTEQIYAITQKTNPEITKDDIVNKMNREWFANMSYPCALMLDNKEHEANTGTTYATVTPYIKNVNIRNFYRGIRLYYAYDEIAATGSGRPALENVTVNNMFGDGIALEGCMATINGYACGIIGGSAVALNGPDKADNSGPHRNQNAYTNMAGLIDINNPTDGTGLYLKYEIAYNDAIAAIFTVFNDSISAVVNMVISSLISKYLTIYTPIDPAYRQKILDSKTNVLDTQVGTDGVSRDMFNLFYFNASAAGSFTVTDQSQIVKFDRSFCLNGIDTTHRFVEIVFYDVLSELDGFAGIVSQYGDMLKNIKIILVNFNYVDPALGA